MFKKIKILFQYIRKFGLANALRIYFYHYITGGVIQLSIPYTKYPLRLRGKTTDIGVFERIFLFEDYNLPLDIKPRFIIDGGAYIGLSSVFFANKYPEAKIIAIEPEISNYNLLLKNIINYSNIEPINSAIWSKDTNLRIQDAGLGHYGFMVEEGPKMEGASLEATTISGILKKFDYNKIDILKLDIEGSEKEVFSNNYKQWLDKVNILIIELHDRKIPGCSHAFYTAINNYKYTETKHGENIILIMQ